MHERYLQELLQNFRHDPPARYVKPSAQQLLRADRQVFDSLCVCIRSATPARRAGDGTRYMTGPTEEAGPWSKKIQQNGGKELPIETYSQLRLVKDQALDCVLLHFPLSRRFGVVQGQRPMRR